MFFLVPAHPGFPGQIPQSRKTVVVVVVVAEVCVLYFMSDVLCLLPCLCLISGIWPVKN